MQWQSVLGFGLMFSLLLFAPEPSFAGCRNSGGSSGSSLVGSQVNGGSVTICAEAVAVTPARTAVVKNAVTKTVSSKTASSKTVAKPAAKVAAKVVAKVAPKVISKPAIFRRTQAVPLKAAPTKSIATKSKSLVAKPTSKLKTVKKIVATTITKPGSQNKTAAVADFTPASVSASVYPSDQLTVGQTASFSSSAIVHYQTGTLLNLPTEVRFTPIAVHWDFDTDGSGTGSNLGHAFSSAGIHEVQLRVVYSVSYRIKGSINWIAEPDTITMNDNLLVTVSGDAGETPDVPIEVAVPRTTLLVGSDCIKRPGTFGCR